MKITVILFNFNIPNNNCYNYQYFYNRSWDCFYDYHDICYNWDDFYFLSWQLFLTTLIGHNYVQIIRTFGVEYPVRIQWHRYGCIIINTMIINNFISLIVTFVFWIYVQPQNHHWLLMISATFNCYLSSIFAFSLNFSNAISQLLSD